MIPAVQGNIIAREAVVGMWIAEALQDDYDDQGWATMSCQYAEVGFISDPFDVQINRAWSYGHIAFAILGEGHS